MYTGIDLLTGKELSNGDRILRGLSGIADLALAAYGTYKGVQAIKGTNRVIEVEKPKSVVVDDVIEGSKTASGVGNLTKPSLPKGGKPKGNYAKGKSRGIIKQNETADILASEGYDITLLDDVNGGNGYGIKETSNPDWLIENNVFDCYAPDPAKGVDNIIREMKGKTKSQAEYLVLNLDDFDQPVVDELVQAIKRKSLLERDLRRLKEVIFVKDGKVNHVFWRE